MKGFRSLFLVIGLVSLASCNQGSDTGLNGGGSIGNWIIPNPGTMYVFGIAESDSLFGPMDTIVILSTHGQIGGRKNVVRFGPAGAGNVGFVNIESNGNFSLGDSSSFDFRWTTFPTGSRKTISDPTVDTIEFSEHVITSDARSYVGSETLRLAGRSLTTQHVREVRHRSTTDSLNSFFSQRVDTTDMWVAPSIGFIVQEHDRSFEDGKLDQDFHIQLLQYIPH